jgi:hypothetical protein
VREGLTVALKYLVRNIATQTGKDQTVQVIERLLKVDIGGFLYQQQIDSLYGRVFRSIEGHIVLHSLPGWIPGLFSPMEWKPWYIHVNLGYTISGAVIAACRKY